jgi:hypothetical protein
VVVNATSRDCEHSDNREGSETCRQPKHCDVSKMPAQQASYGGARQVAGVIVCLVTAVLTVESRLAH